MINVYLYQTNADYKQAVDKLLDETGITSKLASLSQQYSTSADNNGNTTGTISEYTTKSHTALDEGRNRSKMRNDMRHAQQVLGKEHTGYADYGLPDKDEYVPNADSIQEMRRQQQYDELKKELGLNTNVINGVRQPF